MQIAIRLCVGVLCCGAASVAWGQAPAKKGAKPAVAPAKPSTMPVLRTAERKIVDAKGPAAVGVASSSIDGTEQLLELRITNEALANEAQIRSVGGGPAAIFVGSDTSTLWVRRPAADAARALEGELYGAQSGSLEPAVRAKFTVAAPDQSKRDPEMVKRFGAALQSYFATRVSGAPFYAFAADRVQRRWVGAPEKRGATRPGRPELGEVRRLMDTTTGMASIQESVQADRALFIAAAKDKATVPLNTLKPPQLEAHPFEKMLLRVPRSSMRPVDEERLADATPAEFWYLRVADLDVLFTIVDQLDAWGTPAANVLEQAGEDRALSERTLTQLGLDRGPLSRALGTQVVADFAVVGSDPYLREGSDVTILFRVKQAQLFNVALAGAMEKHLAAHGGELAKAGATGEVQVRRSADGKVRQHRATVGDIEIVSNSLAATRRVLDAIAKKGPRLAEEPDFRYMRARSSPAHADAVVFMGDRFIANVVGPRQKIMVARRQLALAELLAPNYAALLHGWMEGKVPASVDALVASGWLKKDELKHADGSPIELVLGRGARSRHGTAGFLEPLLDLEPPKTVTPAERDAYNEFAARYQSYWREYIDPIYVRFNLERVGKQRQLLADVRVLPLIVGSEYREISEMVGQARLTTPELAGGLRAVLGVGQEARLRRELSHMADRSSFGQKFLLDWLGDWIFFGVEDRPEVVQTVAAFERRSLPQPPEGDDAGVARHENEWSHALRTPAYLCISVKNPIGATVFLTAVRKLASDAAKDMVSWGEAPQYKGTTVTRITVRGPRTQEGALTGSIYYAITGDAIMFSLSESVIHHLLDERLAGKGTQVSTDAAKSTQFAFQWASTTGSPLNTLLGWFLERDAMRSRTSALLRAEALLRGVPGASVRETGLAYEGAEPLPTDGGHFTLGPDGVRDPARGSAIAERWPPLPVTGSPVQKLIAAVARFEAQVSFDDEPRLETGPQMRSLHVRAKLGLND